jgi:hypothetical protein
MTREESICLSGEEGDEEIARLVEFLTRSMAPLTVEIDNNCCNEGTTVSLEDPLLVRTAA